MKVQLKKVTVEEKEILRYLLSIYLDECTKNHDIDHINNGKLLDYGGFDLYCVEPGLDAFFIKAEGRVIGFIMLQSGSYAPPSGEDYYVTDFYILKNYRRKGYGSAAAAELFSTFSGQYLVSIKSNNATVIDFLHKVYRTHHIQYIEKEIESEEQYLQQMFQVN